MSAPKVPFTQPSLSLAEQVELFATRGLIISDREAFAQHLTYIGYYRFTGYCQPFRANGSAALAEGVKFEHVLDVYQFDRKLRAVLMDALERIEVAFKSSISEAGTNAKGAFWLCDPANFDRGTHDQIKKILDDCVGEQPENHQHAFIANFYAKYSDPYPPSWMLMEAFSFGAASRIYKLMRGELRQPVAAAFGAQHDVLGSWLHVLSFARNVCAHHQRTWNRYFTIIPKIPKAYQGIWPTASRNRLYVICAIIRHLLTVIDHNVSTWHGTLKDVIAARPASVTLASMGFPDDWDQQRY